MPCDGDLEAAPWWAASSTISQNYWFSPITATALCVWRCCLPACWAIRLNAIPLVSLSWNILFSFSKILSRNPLYLHFVQSISDMSMYSLSYSLRGEFSWEGCPVYILQFLLSIFSSSCLICSGSLSSLILEGAVLECVMLSGISIVLF